MHVMGLPSALDVCNLGEDLLSSIHHNLLCNLGYFSKCVDGHDYGRLDNLRWPDRFKFLPQILSCSKWGRGSRWHRVLPVQIQLTKQVLQKPLLVIGMCHVGPTCKLASVEGESSALCLDSGSTKGCTTSSTCGMLKLHMLSKLLAFVTSTSQWWISTLW